MEEELSEISVQEEKSQEVESEESSEIYGEETEYVAFSPQELELFILRSETWDKLVKGEIRLEEAKSILEKSSIQQIATTESKGRRKRRRK